MELVENNIDSINNHKRTNRTTKNAIYIIIMIGYCIVYYFNFTQNDNTPEASCFAYMLVSMCSTCQLLCCHEKGIRKLTILFVGEAIKGKIRSCLNKPFIILECK